MERLLLGELFGCRQAPHTSTAGTKVQHWSDCLEAIRMATLSNHGFSLDVEFTARGIDYVAYYFRLRRGNLPILNARAYSAVIAGSSCLSIRLRFARDALDLM